MAHLAQSLRLARRLLFTATLALAPLAAVAQQQVTVSADKFVAAAIAKQQYDLARQVLQAMLRNNPDDIEAHFLLAQIDGYQHDLKGAIDGYRKILSAHPDIVRVRLELARALFLSHDDTTAEYHFRLVLAKSDLPPTVVANIEKFLNAIRSRRNWQFSINASLAPNTNINSGPSTSQIDIAGLPFTLSDTAQQQSGLGIVFTTSGEYDFHLADQLKLRNGASLYRAEYPGKNFDDLMTEFYMGPQWVGQRYDISVLGVLDRRWYANDPYNVGYGPRIEVNWNATPRLRIETQVEGLVREYRAATSFLNGYLTDANVAALYAVTPTSYARAVVGIGYEHTQADYFANKFYRIGIGYHQELPWGISVEDQPELYNFRYEGTMPLFDVVRNDWLIRNTLSVYKRDWHFWGFSPTFSYIFTHDASNVPLFRYTQHQFQIGFTKEF